MTYMYDEVCMHQLYTYYVSYIYTQSNPRICIHIYVIYMYHVIQTCTHVKTHTHTHTHWYRDPLVSQER